jgi:hypothetical protein
MIALAEATDSALREVALEPLSSRADDSVAWLIGQLDEALASHELKMVRQLKSAKRAQVAAEFQRIADSWRVMLAVAEQIEELGGEAPTWSIPLAAAMQRLRRRLKERGLPLGPPRRPIPKVVRDGATGEFRVFDPADLERLVALTSATTNLGNALLRNWAPARPLGETAPATVENLRKLLATVTPERLQHLDAQRAALAARVLDQTHEHVRKFLAFVGQLGQQGEAWFGEMTGLLAEVEIALTRLHSIEAAPAEQPSDPDNLSGQQVREIGVRYLPGIGRDTSDLPPFVEEESLLTIRPKRTTIWINEAVPILAPRRPHVPVGDVLDENE